MDIKFEIGSIYDNKTGRYIKPLLNDKTYYPEFLRKYILSNYIGMFIGDMQYSQLFPNNQFLLFVVIDINGKYVDKLQQYMSIERGRRDYKEFLRQWQTKKVGTYKVYDYVWGNLDESHRHVFVLNISNYSYIKDYFEKGKYSNMFTAEELRKLNITKTKNGKPSNLYATFTKDSQAKELFKQRIQAEFDTVLKDTEVPEEFEADIPPVKRFEILNYS